jgi:hypothetical protein
MANPADKAVAATDRLYRALDHPDELAGITARALLDAAQRAAGSRPTPQAPMVAAAFRVDNEAIRGPQSGTLAELTMGAEFGSTTYRQFGARHGRGSWLFPTIAEPPAEVERAQADYLDKVTHG